MPAAKSRPAIFILLGVAVVGGLASLPWQLRQWKEAQHLKHVATLEELRLRDLRTRRSEAEALEEKLRQSPDDIATQLEAARLYLSQGKTDRGAELLQNLEHRAALDPALSKDASLAGALSALFERLGWLDKAYSHAKRAFSLEPDSVEAVMRIAFLEAMLGWQKACQQHVNQALKQAPDSAGPHLALALVNDQIGGAVAAEQELLKADAIRPNDTHILLLLARNRITQKHFDQALATLDRAQNLSPNDASLAAARVDALLQKYDRSHSKSPEDIQAIDDAAQRYFHLSPESPEARFLRGKALSLKGDTKQALAIWEELYTIKPDLAWLRLNLGTTLARNGQRERAAKIMDEERTARSGDDLYHRLVTTAGQQPDNPEPHRQLARVCRTQYRLPRSILEWQEVLRLKPGDPEAIAAIAAAKKKRGDLYP